MLRIYFLHITFFFSVCFSAQVLDRPSPTEIAKAPIWAQLMYSLEPNVFEVDEAYKAYHVDKLFEKNFHTQYYKRWRRSLIGQVNADGSIRVYNEAEKRKNRERLIETHYRMPSGDWSLLGPVNAYRTNGELVAQQSNIYSLDQSLSDSDILYCGTEPGEVYRSDDGASSWYNVSLNDPLAGGVRSIRIHPTDPSIVLAGSGSVIFRTTDGGATWLNVLSSIGRTNEFFFIPSDPDIVLAATNGGLYRSTDAGLSWSQLYGDKSYDIKGNTGDDAIIYVLKHNSSTEICEFLSSSDHGATFSVQSSGWFSSTDPGRYDGGGRLAVTPADPDRIYAYLIGEAKTGDTGYIGVYRSDDGGDSWTLPNGPAGGPYDTGHQNLAIGSPDWQYHQGFYNCALMASNDDPDKILLGGLNLYTSDDAGATFYPLAGYVGGDYSIHVDMQDFRNTGTKTWVTTDGGIYASDDFFETDAFEVKMQGIHGSDYWGFGQGWNRDVTVGGLYHNGNLSSFDNWGEGEFLQLGGGEPASGYVNPGMDRRVYSSDINGKIIPMLIGDPVENVGFGIDPNESYYAAESSELEFDPRCYSIAYTGLDNVLWRTEDMGNSFTPFFTFGSNSNDEITQIEFAWSDPQVMYVHQMIGSSSIGKLWRTNDGGEAWAELELPLVSNSRVAMIQCDPEDANGIYIAFTYAGNNQKVYKSIDGGDTWVNLTTPSLYNQSAHTLAVFGGSDEGVYYATNERVYYRNASMEDWEIFSDGLPAKFNSNIARPFYRDAKIRVASYGKGIWESPFFEEQARPVAQISVDRLELTAHCDSSIFHYVDHSMLAHDGASWEWTFQGGIPATANGTWEQRVFYESPGTYLTILTVTDINGVSDTDSLFIEIDAYVPSGELAEGFENGFLPVGFELDNPDQGQTWELFANGGAYGTSERCMVMRGFDYWPGGDEDDVSVSVDLSSMEDIYLTFDVAYAQYATNYSDSLEVLISTDCGETMTSMYFKGGDDLATAADNTDSWVPSSDEWRTDSVDLSGYIGNPDVMIVFRSHTGWGNNYYIDNIELDEELIIGVPELIDSDLSIYPNPVATGEQIELSRPLKGAVDFDLYDLSGKHVFHAREIGVRTFDIPQISIGSYIYVLRSRDLIKKGLLEISD